MRNHPSVLAIACLILGVGLVAFGLWSGIEATSAYHVRFSEPGGGCGEGDALVLDQDDGSPLSCAGRATGTGPFTEAERNQLVALSRQLGEDGISPADEDAVQALNARIAAAHGDPDRSKQQTGSPGHLSFLFGVPVAIIGLLWTIGSRGSRS